MALSRALGCNCFSIFWGASDWVEMLGCTFERRGSNVITLKVTGTAIQRATSSGVAYEPEKFIADVGRVRPLSP